MYIYKWHEVDQTKHYIFCVHIVCNEIQVKVNLEIITFFFYLHFPYCPNFFWFGVVFTSNFFAILFFCIYIFWNWLIDWLIRMLSVMLVVYWSPFIDTRKGHLQTEVGSLHGRGVCWRKLWIALVCIRMVSSWFYGMSSVLLKYNVCHDGWTYTEGATWAIFRDDIMDLRVQDSDLSQPVWHKQAHFSSENVKI